MIPSAILLMIYWTLTFDDDEHAFEWVLALFMHLFILITWKSWFNTGFKQRALS